jgi:hypothetical protein
MDPSPEAGESIWICGFVKISIIVFKPWPNLTANGDPP